MCEAMHCGIGKRWCFIHSIIGEEAEIKTNKSGQPVVILCATVSKSVVKTGVLESTEAASSKSSVFGIVFIALRCDNVNIPFSIDIFAICKTIGVKKSADSTGGGIKFIGIIGIEMPGIEVQGEIVFDKICEKTGGIVSVVNRGGAGPSYLKEWVVGFEGLHSSAVDSIVFICCTIPEANKVGFIPYLPVSNIIVVAIVPAVIVMHNDVFADLSPLAHIFWRITKAPIVTCAFAQTVEDATASIYDSSYMWVTCGKIIT